MPSYPIPTTTISALTSATTPLAGTEVLPIVQSGTTKNVSVTNLTVGRTVTAKQLYIDGTTSRIDINSSGTGGFGGYDLLSIHSTNGVETLIGAFGISAFGYCGTYSNHPFTILTNNIEQLRISITGNVGIGISSPTAYLHLKAGTATANTAPIKFTSGVNLTTAEAGAVEYNGTTAFVTGTAASGRGIILAPQMVRLNADRTKAANDTTLEAIFDSTNDALDLEANTLYHFRGVLYFTKTATAASTNIILGFSFSQTQQNIAYSAIANGAASAYCSRIISAGASSIGVSNTALQTTTAIIEGFFKSNATTGGTITPQFAQGQAGTTTAPSVLAGSFIMIQPMSSNVNATVLAGNWS